MKAYKLLKQLRLDQEKNTAAAETGYFDHKYEVKKPRTAAQLESLVSELIYRSGGVCTIVTTAGRQITKKNKVRDVLGNERTLIDSKYIPGTTERGTADLIACLNGKYYALEVKFSLGDRQSDVQKRFQSKVERAGGTYMIVKTLDDILEII